MYIGVLGPLQIIWLEKHNWTTSSLLWFLPSNLIAIYAIVIMLANEKIQKLLLKASHYMEFLDQLFLVVNGT